MALALLTIAPASPAQEPARDAEGVRELAGEHERLAPTEKALEQGRFVSGRRSGPWRFRYADGTLRAKGSYSDGVLTGNWEWRYPDGTTRAEGKYKAGWREGEWRAYGPDGSRDPLESGTYDHLDARWEETGEPRAQGALLDGAPHGAWTYWWPAGQRMLEGTYRRGVPTGAWRFWHADGVPATGLASGNYTDGVLDEPLADHVWQPDEPEGEAGAPLIQADPDFGRLARAQPASSAEEIVWNANLRRVSALLEGSQEERTRALEELQVAGRDAVPVLSNALLELDLARPADVERGRWLHAAACRIVGAVPWLAWSTDETPEARRKNARSVRGWHSLWNLTKDDPLFWAFEVRAYGSAGLFEPGPLSHPPLQVLERALALTRPSARGPFNLRARGGAGTEGPLRSGLAWLARHQQLDGSWDCDGFMAHDPPDDASDGPGQPQHDVGVTALSLLALMRGGSTPTTGPYADAVARGVLWLIEQQDYDSGVVGQRGSARVVVPRAGERQEPCRYCGGRGTSECRSCQGGRVQCGICVGGKLVTGFDCTRCGGDGWLDCTSCRGSSRVDCSACGGGRFQRAVSTPYTPGDGYPYHHALATLALCQALADYPTPALRGPAQKAVNAVKHWRNPYGAWRYDRPPVGDNDTSVTVWMALALAAADEIGLRVDAQALEDARTWVDEVTDRATGRVGYESVGSLSSRVSGVNDQYPTDQTEAMTAAGLLVRLVLGADPAQEDIVRKHADLLLRALPEWDPDGLQNDVMAWGLGTWAMYRVGDHDSFYWRKWNAAAKKALLESQRTDGAVVGSWDPIGPWGYAGGRVYTTAMACLCLSVYGSDPARVLAPRAR